MTIFQNLSVLAYEKPFLFYGRMQMKIQIIVDVDWIFLQICMCEKPLLLTMLHSRSNTINDN